MKQKWETLEGYVRHEELVNGNFNVYAVAQDLAIPTWEASGLIQDYLAAQSRGETNFVLRRVTGTRTRNAMWHVGQREKDVHEIGSQLVNDLQRRYDRFTQPALVHVARMNPKVAAKAEKALKKMNSAVAEFAAAFNGRADGH